MGSIGDGHADFGESLWRLCAGRDNAIYQAPWEPGCHTVSS
jgi:hypothetical protein